MRPDSGPIQFFARLAPAILRPNESLAPARIHQETGMMSGLNPSLVSHYDRNLVRGLCYIRLHHRHFFSYVDSILRGVL